jgi:ketosteroid isomerase-like protein
MSENLDLVRSIYAAWERGDHSSVEWASPEIEWVRIGGPSPGKSNGVAGLAEHWRDWLSAWEGSHQVAEDYRELDGERVLVLLRFRGRGKASGLDLGTMAATGANVFEMRGGKVTRIVTYYENRDRALADLGLAE